MAGASRLPPFLDAVDVVLDQQGEAAMAREDASEARLHVDLIPVDCCLLAPLTINFVWHSL